MAARLATLGSQSEATEAVRRALEGGRADWRSRAWEAFLVISLVVSFFFLGLMLFLMTLVLNVLSERFVRRIRSAY